MPDGSPRPAPARISYALLFGLSLTLQGYRSLDGDQAYRLPILLNRQDPAVFADDPFVRAFDAFNPHRGYLALLDAPSRLIGLPASLFLLYAATFAVTCVGLRALARAAWPGSGEWAGILTVALVLLADAGNVGTNHLFEPMLLDRLIGFGLGWVALSGFVRGRGGIGGAALIGLAGLVHPSVGIQLGMLLGAGWVACLIRPGTLGVGRRSAWLGIGALGLALLPTVLIQAPQKSALFDGLDPETFRLLSFHVQGPQHMLPGLWRGMQWLAWFGYPALAGLTLLANGRPISIERLRLSALLGLLLLGLSTSWVAVEVLEDPRVTVFQPFRMATIARGLCLVLVAERVRSHWRAGGLPGTLRGCLLVAGLGSDGSMVVAVLAELACSLGDRLALKLRGLRSDARLDAPSSAPSPGLRPPSPPKTGARVGFGPPLPARGERDGVRGLGSDAGPGAIAGLVVLVVGLAYLARHDPESGQWPLLGGIVLAVALWGIRRRWAAPRWTIGRALRLAAVSYTVPALALLAALLPPEGTPAYRAAREALISRCRFGESPTDDVERLALWARAHTPESARFVGPPGPKTFRLWSRREVAFNRAAGPYDATGLADWASRFADHVAFDGPTEAFALAYLSDRHALERRYQQMSDADRAALARRQGADHVLAAAPDGPPDPASPLELLRVDGRYAIYRLRDEARPGPIPALARRGRMPPQDRVAVD
ncbi:DUF6798 domain-containing protein [Tautonia plasticadhaerens]|uniref:DUF6798 domain-containing protein n=1 Tax=Tautonia plasticadhaerens TaxID=2527974 RepID=A0A518H2U1_9BACT|nr:DUF6798 domain-containing protein [Tautonia plasticadhaerens]QDV35143.1 hypothetical protein ElP_30460 [Tautonia plasticadhaerens]